MSIMLFRVAAAVVVLSTAVGSVALPHTKGITFTLDAIPSPQGHPFDPAAKLQMLQAKYPTEGSASTKRSEASQHGAIPASAKNSGLAFYVPVVIGDQAFQMVFDTGSADLSVYSNELEHPVYIPTDSAESLPKSTWSIKYAVQAGPVVAPKQAVQAATQIPFEFGSDGILGLAFSTINTVQPVKQKTFIETLLSTLDRKLNAANLRGGGKPSTWDFGYIDGSKFSGDITDAPVATANKYCSIDVGSYAVGKGAFSASHSKVGEVIVDSGTSLVYLPETIVNDYYSQVEGYQDQYGGHTFWCNSTVPDFRFKIGDVTLSIPGSLINYNLYNPANGICVGGITSQLNGKYSVPGSLFITSYYVVHSLKDVDEPQVGFASHWCMSERLWLQINS